MIRQLFAVYLLLVENASGARLSPYSGGNGTETGIVMSGGGQALNKWVEVFIPSSGYSCILPSLPDDRKDHTMNDMYICGGSDYYARDLCIQFVDGQWTSLSSTQESRDEHSSWLTPQGLVLLGGTYTMQSTEIITLKGEQGGPGFNLNYNVRGSCVLEDKTTNSIIVTGGMGNEVTRYDLLGYLEDLPSMIRIRNNHGCGSYVSSDGNQILLAAGGFDHVEFEYMSSTELLKVGADAWTMSTPLPAVMYGMRSASVDNKVFFTGGHLQDVGIDTDNIEEWDAAENEWKRAGKMMTARSSHAASSIQLDDSVMSYCM